MDIYDFIKGTCSMIDPEIKVVCNNPEMEKKDVDCRDEFNSPQEVSLTDTVKKEVIL